MTLHFNIGNQSSFERAPSADSTGSSKIGVLLSNLGTPNGTDYWSVRKYLAEFLSDRRVIEAPRLL